ncbi:unnamed protein product, partial [Darwinula stevensoni]
ILGSNWRFTDVFSFFRILDDKELYEDQKPISLSDLTSLSRFLNQFLFKSLWTELISSHGLSENHLFASLHKMLVLIYWRDSRRRFTTPNHWLLKDVSVSSFLYELEKKKPRALVNTFILVLMKKMPHLIPHHERVILFRKAVQEDKERLGLLDSSPSHSCFSTVISVHRSSLVDDGYRQLSSLTPTALKGVIRVKFINLQGLDEAGIDQDGVFKIGKSIDPSHPLCKGLV